MERGKCLLFTALALEFLLILIIILLAKLLSTNITDLLSNLIKFKLPTYSHIFWIFVLIVFILLILIGRTHFEKAIRKKEIGVLNKKLKRIDNKLDNLLKNKE